MPNPELIHIAEALSKSQYFDKNIALSLPFKSVHGTVTLWFNKSGVVVGLDYYREIFGYDKKPKVGTGKQ